MNSSVQEYHNKRLETCQKQHSLRTEALIRSLAAVEISHDKFAKKLEKFREEFRSNCLKVPLPDDKIDEIKTELRSLAVRFAEMIKEVKDEQGEIIRQLAENKQKISQERPTKRAKKNNGQSKREELNFEVDDDMAFQYLSGQQAVLDDEWVRYYHILFENRKM